MSILHHKANGVEMNTLLECAKRLTSGYMNFDETACLVPKQDLLDLIEAIAEAEKDAEIAKYKQAIATRDAEIVKLKGVLVEIRAFDRYDIVQSHGQPDYLPRITGEWISAEDVHDIIDKALA